MPASDDIIYTPHLKASWGGTLGVPAIEQWSNTVRFFDFPGAMPTPSQLTAAVEAAAPVLQVWFQHAESRIGNVAGLTFLKLNNIGIHGLQSNETTVAHFYTPTVMGPRAGGVIWEQSYCLTLRTDKPRGRAHSGRIFPPINGEAPQGGNAYCGADVATEMAARFATCLKNMSVAMNTAFAAAGMVSPGFVSGVISPGSTAASKPELRSVFTGVVCDRVADIQHRRTRQIPRAEGTLAPIV